MPEHARCQTELVSLERDAKTGKIDHPATGSKDIADSLAGVVYGLTMRREVWGMYSVPTMMVPDSVNDYRDRLQENDTRLKGRGHTQESGVA